MMRLAEVIAGAGRLVRGSAETAISAIAYDSRRVTPGALFCALGGTRQDGAAFVNDALARGAAAVLSSAELPGTFPLVLAGDPRRAMALCAAGFYRFPASRLSMLGVTGTNGKTTAAYLVEAMAAAAGRRTGLVGTVEQRFAGISRESTHTTPESVDLQALLAEMVDASVEIVAMEVSSHALVQRRVDGIRFRAAALTNLTRDHLDFHGTMEAYFDAKLRLFQEHLAGGGTAVVPAADPFGERVAEALRGGGRTVWRWGVDVPAELRARDVRLSLEGFEATFDTPTGTFFVRSPLVGLHNLKNALVAAGLALAGGIPAGAIAAGLAATRGAPGRLESVADAAGRRVFVDYAHTDDALARVLDFLRSLTPAGRRVVCVFGCGGDRDPGKRPLMGAAAGARADIVVVTSDNPRTEPPGRIIQDVLPGLESVGCAASNEQALGSGAKGHLAVHDRAEAITAAVRLTRPGDVLLIAGKGHERYQLVGTEKRPFDDREVARRALAGEGTP